MDLLLAHGDDGSPMLDDADPGIAATVAAPVERREQRYLADITAGANDLTRQGWAVVASDDPEGARLEALVRDLVHARAEEQGEDVLPIQVPPGMNNAQAIAWKKSVFPTLYGGDETRRPRYLLILGDLDHVSLDTQQVLAHDSITGRLACENDGGYGAYVEKLLRWQRTPSTHTRARALFYTVHDGTRATAAGHEKLIQPCHKRCASAARDKPRVFPASVDEPHGARMPNPDELRQLAAARQPSVLLSMSHGVGPPRRGWRSPADARQRQGAMSFHTAGALGARDLASAPFLPGGLWIYFACFGAGTPAQSAYHHWLDMLARQGMADLGPLADTLSGLDKGSGFVSGLGKAALAHPEGPLAVLSHIDLAWSYSYEELQVGGDADAGRVTGSNRSLNFFQLISKLVAGERAGAAALALKSQLGTVGAELTAHYDRCKREGTVEGGTPVDRLALGHLWMLHQDLLGYALLGDPAVRLPLASRDPRPAPDPHSDPHPDPRPVPARIELDADALDRLDRLERAALAVAYDENESPGVIALKLRLQPSEVKEAARVYREAGRAALSALLGREQDEEGKP